MAFQPFLLLICTWGVFLKSSMFETYLICGSILRVIFVCSFGERLLHWFIIGKAFQRWKLNTDLIIKFLWIFLFEMEILKLFLEKFTQFFVLPLEKSNNARDILKARAKLLVVRLTLPKVSGFYKFCHFLIFFPK